MRVIDFALQTHRSKERLFQASISVNDGSRCDFALDIEVYNVDISSLDSSQKICLKRTGIPHKQNRSNSPSIITMVAEDDGNLSQRLEKWSMDYAEKFSRQYCKFYQSFRNYTFGLFYTSKQLPGVRSNIKLLMIRTLLNSFSRATLLQTACKSLP
jgi:hypothetical protein